MLIANMCNIITHNLQNKKFMLLVEDDIHFIHAKHHPTSSVTSTIWHMCTAIVDVHEKLEAVDVGDDVTKNHRNVRVTMEDGTVRPCRGGIDIQHLLGFISVESGNYSRQSFLQRLPSQFRKFNLSNVEKSSKELRYMYIHVHVVCFVIYGTPFQCPKIIV